MESILRSSETMDIAGLGGVDANRDRKPNNNNDLVQELRRSCVLVRLQFFGRLTAGESRLISIETLLLRAILRFEMRGSFVFVEIEPEMNEVEVCRVKRNICGYSSYLWTLLLVLWFLVHYWMRAPDKHHIQLPYQRWTHFSRKNPKTMWKSNK